MSKWVSKVWTLLGIKSSPDQKKPAECGQNQTKSRPGQFRSIFLVVVVHSFSMFVHEMVVVSLLNQG